MSNNYRLLFSLSIVVSLLGTTGHAEAVKITYDPTQISYGKLLKIYFLIAHDPLKG